MSNRSFARLMRYDDPIYVANALPELEKIAHSIRPAGYPLARACLFRMSHRVEIRTWLGLGPIVASVEISGSESVPHTVRVTTTKRLTEASMELFRKNLPGLHIKFKKH